MTSNKAFDRNVAASTVTAPGPPGSGAKAVLLMAYGSPHTRAEILPYYTHMRRGRPPSPEALAELERRYDAIGGSSPLPEITRSQANALQRELQRREGAAWRVVVGMKHSSPFLEDAVGQLMEAGVTSAVGLVMAPHFSTMSVGEYVERAENTLAQRPSRLSLRFVTDWHLDPGYVGWLAERGIAVRLDRETAARRWSSSPPTACPPVSRKWGIPTRTSSSRPLPPWLARPDSPTGRPPGRA